MQVGVPSIREHMTEHAAASGEYHAKRVEYVTKVCGGLHAAVLQRSR